MHMTGATDCHQENIIAVRSHPVLVDTETLGNFHNGRDQAGSSKVATIFRTGYLPIPAEIDPLAMDYAWSALDPVARQDRINVHLPRFADRCHTSRDFAPEITEGFSSMSDFVSSHRTNRKFQEYLSHFAVNHPRRLLYRNTRNYVQMIETSLLPDTMRDGIARSAKLIQLLWRKDIDPVVAQQEFVALSQLDIPFFLRAASDRRRRAETRLCMEDALENLSVQSELLHIALSKA
jgi:lantibiotic modifying enzyme